MRIEASQSSGAFWGVWALPPIAGTASGGVPSSRSIAALDLALSGEHPSLPPRSPALTAPEVVSATAVKSGYLLLHTHFNGILSSKRFLTFIGKAVAGRELPYLDAVVPCVLERLRELEAGFRGRSERLAPLNHIREVFTSEQLPPSVRLAQLERLLDTRLVPYDAAYGFRKILRDMARQLAADPVGFNGSLADMTLHELVRQGVSYAEVQVSREFCRDGRADRLASLAAERGMRVRALLGESSCVRLSDGVFDELYWQELAADLALPWVVGIDFNGPEKAFSESGVAAFCEHYRRMRQLALRLNKPLVLRPHVGEGYADAAVPHGQVARDNLEMLIRAVENLNRSGEYEPRGLVSVRFGHAAHATAEQCARMAHLGINVEVNLTSNRATGSVDNLDEHVLVRALIYGTEVFLHTDGAGVMCTDLRQEFLLAAKLLWRFKHNRFRAEGPTVGAMPGVCDLYFAELVEEQALLNAYARRPITVSEGVKPSVDDQQRALQELERGLSVRSLKQNARAYARWLDR